MRYWRIRTKMRPQTRLKVDRPGVNEIYTGMRQAWRRSATRAFSNEHLDKEPNFAPGYLTVQ